MVNIAALLTARGNNTMKDKNVRLVCGRPLLYYPALAAKNSKYITNFFVSSDDEKILNAAEKCGYTKIKRPKELALPTAQHVESIYHALKIMKEHHNVVPDILVVLLGNSVTIKTEWINYCIKSILDDDSLSAMCPTTIDNDHHPYRANKIDSNGILRPFMECENVKLSSNRQDLTNCHYFCHNFWVLNLKKSIFVNEGAGPWSFMGGKVKAYVVEEAFDVHDEDDIDRSEKWLELNGEV